MSPVLLLQVLAVVVLVAVLILERDIARVEDGKQ